MMIQEPAEGYVASANVLVRAAGLSARWWGRCALRSPGRTREDPLGAAGPQAGAPAGLWGMPSAGAAVRPGPPQALALAGRGALRVCSEADQPRVDCPGHGAVTAAVPWARHGAGHTVRFDETVAWFAPGASEKLISVLLRINWHTPVPSWPG